MRIEFSIFLDRSKPGVRDELRFWLRQLLSAFDGSEQIFNQGACKSHSWYLSFSTEPGLVFCSSWPLRENSTTESRFALIGSPLFP